jgi:acyl-CoA synthetase (AMP-forming)/AMP-acid ligase II
MIPRNLPEILHRAAAGQPQNGVGFIQADGEVLFYTYPDLLTRAGSLLNGLQKLGIKREDHLILALDLNQEIIPLLWSCFLGGIIPTILQPPVSFSDFNPAAEKVKSVFTQLSNPRIVISHHYFSNWNSGQIPDEFFLDFNAIPEGPGTAVFCDPEPGETALIQFSSGSTGDPKGIVLTHRNILVNTGDIATGLDLNSADSSVSWMPLYHDMGLMGFHFTPVYISVSHYFIDTPNFIKNPALWLDSLSEKKATISGCPNFGQILVNRHLSRKKAGNWNFHNLKAILDGAEPISTVIMREFVSLLSPYHFRPEALMPVYGMAEASLAVSFHPLLKEPETMILDRNKLQRSNLAVPAVPGENSIEIVGVGYPMQHTEIRITDEKDRSLPENHIGQVQIKGENVTTGYFSDEEETRHLFTENWFRTGDMGFINNGKLFITGRVKDIIFINGTNYYAHDLENTAFRVPGISFGKVVIGACFDEQEGRDKLLVFLVGSENEATRELIAKIRTAFMQMIGLNPDTFILIRSNEIPRTSSGKIQRYKLVNRFLGDGFEKIIRI